MEENKNIINEPESTPSELKEKKAKKKNADKKPKINNKGKDKITNIPIMLGIISVVFTAIALTLAIVALVFSINAKKDNDATLQFYPDGNGNYIVAAGNSKHLSSIVIPEKYKGGNVIAIDDDGFAECDNLKSIVIPESIRNIGDRAFYGCTELTDVKMGNNVIDIGMHAFYDCSSLANIMLSNNLQVIGEYAFGNCSSLVSISIPDSVVEVGANAFNECNNLGYNKYDNAYYLGSNSNPYHTLAMATDTDITSCEIHPDTKVVYYKAFYYCTNITEIELPEDVLSIGAEAFMYCRNLETVIMHDKIYVINDRVFSSCESLSTIYYSGTDEQLYSIYITSDNEVFYKTDIIVNYTN